MEHESSFHTRLTVTCEEEVAQILIAETSALGFDTFLETDSGFEAYAEADHFDAPQLEEVLGRYGIASFTLDRIQKQNWNELWEKSYDPIMVEDRCLIKAHFHELDDSAFSYVITITPKMSFGTGHHQTTYLMIQAQLDMDHLDKVVMDAGCGTAILSILASMRGAKEVEAFDIDEWSIVNAAENCSNNDATNVNVRLGKVSTLSFDKPFDIILANINKNILLDEMSLYAQHLNPNGTLLMSGFYEKDVPEIVSKATALGFVQNRLLSRETWAALLFDYCPKG